MTAISETRIKASAVSVPSLPPNMAEELRHYFFGAEADCGQRSSFGAMVQRLVYGASEEMSGGRHKRRTDLPDEARPGMKASHPMPISNHDEEMAGRIDSGMVARNRRVRSTLEKLSGHHQAALLAEHGPRQPGSMVPEDWFPQEHVRRLAPVTGEAAELGLDIAYSHQAYGCGVMGPQEALHYTIARLREIDGKPEGRESRKAFVARMTDSANELRAAAATAYIRARAR